MPKAPRNKRNGAAHSSPYKASKPGAGTAIFKMKTDIGQHVLKNPGVAQAIVDKAELKQSDIVLEVGPGTGNLTVKILEKAKKVIAVELDPRMAAEVTKRVQGKPEAKRLEVLLGDVCKMELPYFDVCISNTPYQISSPLTTRLLAHNPPPRICILTYQLEFAQRLTAPSGSPLFSRLSLNTQLFSHATHIMKIGRNNFRPPPAVESSVVRIVPKRPRPGVSWEEWDGLLRVAFVRKNRTMRASFLGQSGVMEMMVGNWKRWCSINSIPIEEGIVEGPVDEAREEVETMELDAPGPEQEEQDMDLAEGDDDDHEWHGIDSPHTPSNLPKPTPPSSTKKGPQTKAARAVREKVRRVLEDVTGLADKRARMCDEGDFLRLLLAFNEEGIHFA